MKNIIAFFTTTLFALFAFASESDAVRDQNIRAEYNKVIEKYKTELNKTPDKIREEIIAYRKEISRLNQQKAELFDKLSQDAQDYLKKEFHYRKKLQEIVDKAEDGVLPKQRTAEKKIPDSKPKKSAK